MKSAECKQLHREMLRCDAARAQEISDRLGALVHEGTAKLTAAEFSRYFMALRAEVRAKGTDHVEEFIRKSIDVIPD